MPWEFSLEELLPWRWWTAGCASRFPPSLLDEPVCLPPSPGLLVLSTFFIPSTNFYLVESHFWHHLWASQTTGLGIFYAFIVYVHRSQRATRCSNYSKPNHLADPAPIAGKPVSQAAGYNALLGPDPICWPVAGPGHTAPSQLDQLD